MKLRKLNEQVMVITGATSGIGKATATQWLETMACAHRLGMFTSATFARESRHIKPRSRSTTPISRKVARASFIRSNQCSLRDTNVINGALRAHSWLIPRH